MVQSRAESRGLAPGSDAHRATPGAGDESNMWRNTSKPPAGLPDWQHDNALFRRLVEDVPDYGIFLLDPDGIVRTWNAGAENIKGYSAGEIIGRHFSAFYLPEQIEAHWPDHELRVARETGRFEDEGWRVRKDGTQFWANVVISRILGDDGHLVGFSKITRDLTAKRKQDELLRRSEERFRLLVEGVRDYAIFMLDPDGNIASWNAGAQQAKGYSAEEIIGRHFSVFYPPEVIASGWPERELQIALEQGRVEDESWRLRKDGSRFWANVVITALRDDSGRHIGFAKVTRDMSEKRRVLALEDEGRRITTFLAMLGHELRNPLAPISNAVSIMQLEPLASERLRMCRDVIARQVVQMTRLVDDLLDVGRITAGKIHLESAAVELGGVIDEAIEAMDPFARSREHTIRFGREVSPAWVRGDRARLLQIVSNLLNNAVKFTGRGGRIDVHLRRVDDKIEVAVRDNGPGIAEHRLADIFNLFVQGDQDTARTQGGLGLGLSLVQQLVTLHGGEVSAYSAGLGKGAEFVVRLPATAAPSGVTRDAAHPSLPRARHVLVVDDNQDAADTLAALLQGLGFHAQTAYDARGALAALRVLMPDVAFLDIGLPDMDGATLAQRIREEFPEPPALVALTGYGQPSDREQTRQAGFVDHLVKPLSADMLIKAMAQLFPGDTQVA